jgi:hypothetical protein
MLIEILGIHPRVVDEPVHLLELNIHEFNGEIDLAEITQGVPSDPHCLPQAPWLPYVLNTDGTAGEEIINYDPIKVDGTIRIAFFLHFLNTSAPLETPFGSVPLPLESAQPTRLEFIKYRPVD